MSKFTYESYCGMTLAFNKSQQLSTQVGPATMPRQIAELFRDPTVMRVVVMQDGLRGMAKTAQHVYTRNDAPPSRTISFEPIIHGSRDHTPMESSEQ